MSARPRCIGIILDGNRRWARAEGMPQLEGHRKGYEKVADCARWIRDRGIPHLVVYAFSTENWNRTQEEVSYLMGLLREMATHQAKELAEEGVRIRFVGERTRLDSELQAAIEKAEKESAENTRLTLWVCLSYGSRAEIVEAVKALTKTGEEVTEKNLAKHFWSAGMPDPDLIIRPGGEKRLSNFLMWQAAYSELFFIKPFWPAFTEADLDAVLTEYAERERRMGK